MVVFQGMFLYSLQTIDKVNTIATESDDYEKGSPRYANNPPGGCGTERLSTKYLARYTEGQNQGASLRACRAHSPLRAGRVCRDEGTECRSSTKEALTCF